jgi:hypothetical protein
LRNIAVVVEITVHKQDFNGVSQMVLSRIVAGASLALFE